ncbi:MAG: SLBB domain-containing protein [Nitrospiraceae bacterium]|nr:SLBB domain-containing protein [Nitrospiraceae bacterium]
MRRFMPFTGAAVLFFFFFSSVLAAAGTIPPATDAGPDKNGREKTASLEMEQFFSGRPAEKPSAPGIRPFGCGLFVNAPSTFAPANETPIGPGYVIGPGDEIKIAVWGRIEGNWDTAVDREGNINIPRIGVIGVTGLTYRELKELLRKEFSKLYTGFEMNVSMGTLKAIRVYVVGNARRPGVFTVSSLSTLINAIFESGGPSKTGSMRRIQLKRGGKTLTELDMYDFLMKGDNSKDVRLMPEDIIYYPPIGPAAGIEGNVRRPAVYELKGPTDISAFLSMAGGASATGYLQRVQLVRVYKNEVKIVVDANLKDLGSGKDILVEDGDLLKVLPVSDLIVNAVTLAGNVARPGLYQWTSGLRVSGIIKDTEKDLLPETYMDFALIERLVPPDYHKENITLDLGKALSEKGGPEDKPLEPFDTLHIFSKWQFIERPKVRIAGAVNRPGEYEFRPNMKISGLVNMAGGPKRYAYLENVELTRVNITNEGPVTERIPLNLEAALAGDPVNDMALKEDDYLFVRTLPDWHLYRTVTVSGEVMFPGVYAIKKGEKLSSLIERAGGFTKYAYPEGAVFTRESVRQMQRRSLEEMVQRLKTELYADASVQVSATLSQQEINAKNIELKQREKFIDSLGKLKPTGRMVIGLAPSEDLKGGVYDLELEEGDTLYVPPGNSVVNVIGAVVSGTTSLVYSDSLGYGDYIGQAGGYSSYADQADVYVLKVDGSARKLDGGAGLFAKSTRIAPGDTIVVPEKFEKVAWLRGVKDITQILMQMAVIAGIAIKVL